MSGTPVPGRIGPFRIEGLLGTGGMGAVYMGRHIDTGVLAAVKVIRPEHAADPTFRARLRREVTAARQVPSFSTAAVVDADVDSDPPWIATEYIDAPTLDVALVGATPLTGAGLEAFAVGVAAALSAIHAHGVIHRDLKPSNVLVTPQGPRVIDFGIARPADDGAQLTRLTRTGHAIGTPTYMAPEQLAGGPVTAAVDIYAWACLVIYAATGQPSRAGQDGTGGPTRPPLDRLPEPLRGLVAAALHPDPAARPTAADLLQRLTGGAAPDPHHAIPAAGPPGPGPAGRPRRAIVALTAALAAATVVGLVAATAAVVRFWPDRSATGDPPASAAAGDPPASAGPGGLPFGTQVLEPLTGHTDGVTAVAVGEWAGRPVAVSGGSDETVRVWDLTTGDQIGEPLTGHANGVIAVAIGDLAGRPVVVSAGYDSVVRVWDLATGALIHELAGHDGAVWGVATANLAGRPVVVSGGIDDTVRIWDLATGDPVGEPWRGHTAAVYDVAVAELAGNPVVVSGSYDGTVRVWDLATGDPVGEPMRGHSLAVHDVAVGELAGSPVVVSGSEDGTVRVRDLATGELLAGPFRGHAGLVKSVAVAEVDGTPIAISGGLDMTVRVWDLAADGPTARPFTRHTGDVAGVAITEIDGVPVAVTGSTDRTVRVWALTPPSG